MQKYRSDFSNPQSDGATLWYADWLGGPTLSKISNCRLENLAGDMRATVYIIGEPDTFFSTPAVCKLFGKRIKGYVTCDDEGMQVFWQVYH